jgi:hypothetical protein
MKLLIEDPAQLSIEFKNATVSDYTQENAYVFSFTTLFGNRMNNKTHSKTVNVSIGYHVGGSSVYIYPDPKSQSNPADSVRWYEWYYKFDMDLNNYETVSDKYIGVEESLTAYDTSNIKYVMNSIADYGDEIHVNEHGSSNAVSH